MLYLVGGNLLLFDKFNIFVMTNFYMSILYKKCRVNKHVKYE